MDTLVIGTRGSPLALAQAQLVRDQLRAAHPQLTVELKIIKTSGDRFQTASLAAAGGKGLFTKEIEDQLLEGAVQLAVHSLKDLPTTLPQRLMIGAVLPREDPRDVLVSRAFDSLESLPPGAVIASGSIRRQAQLRARRPDLQVEEIRGNVETRLRKLTEQRHLAATILAAAGLRRLGIWGTRPDLRWQPLATEVMIPAVGQGAIAIEVAADDTATRERLTPLNDPTTWHCVTAERAFLRAVGGGCQVPFAAHATMADGRLTLVAARFSEDGTRVKRSRVTGASSDAVALGEQAARDME